MPLKLWILPRRRRSVAISMKYPKDYRTKAEEKIVEDYGKKCLIALSRHVFRKVGEFKGENVLECEDCKFKVVCPLLVVRKNHYIDHIQVIA